MVRSEERPTDPGLPIETGVPGDPSIRRPFGLPSVRRWARGPVVRVALRAEALRVSGKLRPLCAVCQPECVVVFRVLVPFFTPQDTV